jgi:hypothetical protein
VNEQEKRQLIAHSAIGLAVCIGAYMALVDSPRKTLATQRTENESLAAQVATAEGLRDQVPAMSAALDKAAQEAARISEFGRPARDERGLFAAMISLAAHHDIRLDELNPMRLGVARDAAPRADAAAMPHDAAVGYSMVAVGSYDHIVTFLRALSGELGYTLIRSVKLTPSVDDKVQLVRAIIETEHFSFDPSARAPLADAGAR